MMARLGILGLNEFAMVQYDNALIHWLVGAQLCLSGSLNRLQSARSPRSPLIRAGKSPKDSDVREYALQTGPLDGQSDMQWGWRYSTGPRFRGGNTEARGGQSGCRGRKDSALTAANSQYDRVSSVPPN